MTAPIPTSPPVSAVRLDDVYTRKVGGESYIYTLDYTPGTCVMWQASVFMDGDLKGRPGGVLTANMLGESALRQQLIAHIEVTIENMIGIEE